MFMGILSQASEVEDLFEGFDDKSIIIPEEKSRNNTDSKNLEDTMQKQREAAGNFSSITGKLSERVLYSWKDDSPHENISSARTSLFLDFEHKFDHRFKIKINGRAYYDAIYAIKGSKKFTQDELDEMQSEIELFDAYIEVSLTDSMDIKIGRQVVVWGRSDTLRVTDVLNPLDNRIPGLVDIEYLRLPVTMAKFDYFIGDWRFTPIAILEQRFSKNPPYGSMFYPVSFRVPQDEKYADVTFAGSIGAEFKGWDINFYAAHIYDDEGYYTFYPVLKKLHEKVNMFGSAINILTGSWLFKTELAYFDGLKYTTTGNKSFNRTDILLGVEYTGLTDTFISYDVVNRNFSKYDQRLLNELNPLNKHEYQHAFRVRSEFMNAALTFNYLITRYGEKLDKGGYQRVWGEYEFDDNIHTTLGVVTYHGDSLLFRTINNNDMIFADVTYSF
jgi:hypothetical protein